MGNFPYTVATDNEMEYDDMLIDNMNLFDQIAPKNALLSKKKKSANHRGSLWIKPLHSLKLHLLEETRVFFSLTFGPDWTVAIQRKSERQM